MVPNVLGAHLGRDQNLCKAVRMIDIRPIDDFRLFKTTESSASKYVSTTYMISAELIGDFERSLNDES